MASAYRNNAFLVFFAIVFPTLLFGQNGKFKVTLDAGHGGKDWGASYNGHVEKNVSLNVVLKVGKILESTPGFEVVYTRKSDVFIELIERSRIANRSNSHIFVSLHCNANANAAAFGTETYVMGMTKLASNLSVAKKENEVIEMEKDYKETYQGFDLNDMGAIIIQEQYLENSIALAAKVQNRFIDEIGRKSRGVKQAPYLVLNQTFMPRVLIEMGFISNPTEGAYLDSEEGQTNLARAIANAIISYKKEYYGDGSVPPADDKPSEKMAEPVVKTAADEKPAEPIVQKNDTPVEVKKGLVFKVQISASGRKLETVPSNFKGLNPISVTQEGGTLYKYMYGETSDYDTAKKNLADAKAKGYTSAFIVAYRDGKKIQYP